MATKDGKPVGGRSGMTQVEVSQPHTRSPRPLPQINACWVEAVRKENKGRVLKEEFDFNPKNRKCNIFFSDVLSTIAGCPLPRVVTEITSFLSFVVIAITQKPTQCDPRAAATQSSGDNEEDLRILQEKLESLKRQPKKKYNYP